MDETLLLPESEVQAGFCVLEDNKHDDPVVQYPYNYTRTPRRQSPSAGIQPFTTGFPEDLTLLVSSFMLACR